MTPAARIAAAIGLLDQGLAGEPVERSLTNWARANRYAGSGDRQAIRDLVFDGLRRRRSFGHLGGADTGRGIMLGALRAAGEDPALLFTGKGYAPDALSVAEAELRYLATASRGERLDCPDWLLPHFDAALGDQADQALTTLQSRAPVFLRVNLARNSREDCQTRLCAEGIATRPHPLSPSALEVTEGARKIAGSESYRTGLVELQDAASQAVADAVPVLPGQEVLDYCAGGGGKTLAMAARVDARFTAHDADFGRMRDLPERAARAGVGVTLAETAALRPGYDVVLCDVPCSGSGSWRRAPQAKWQLTSAKLDSLLGVQAKILDTAAALVAEGGILAYVTCSLFDVENAAQIDAFQGRNPGWRCVWCRNFTPAHGGDGFFAAHLTRA